jgi:hypothetical protein
MVHMPVKACLDTAHPCGLPSRLKSMNPKSKSPPKAGAKTKPIKVRRGEKVVLLSGGNPQIAKADGDAPVQAYIAAMPGWVPGRPS